MTYKEVINKIKPDLEKTIEYFKNELAKIRTGRASPALVEDVEVDYYGTKLPLKQLASITAPEPREIIIQPWDKGSVMAIKNSILGANLGMAPVVDGEIIRLSIPQLTEETRRELAKILRTKIEEARVSIRRKREETWNEIQDLFQAGEIREDDKFRGKDELQKIIDEYNGKIEEMGKRKEGEIMTV